jgi:peroxiredoxin
MNLHQHNKNNTNTKIQKYKNKNKNQHKLQINIFPFLDPRLSEFKTLTINNVIHHTLSPEYDRTRELHTDMRDM